MRWAAYWMVVAILVAGCSEGKTRTVSDVVDDVNPAVSSTTSSSSSPTGPALANAETVLVGAHHARIEVQADGTLREFRIVLEQSMRMGGVGFGTNDTLESNAPHAFLMLLGEEAATPCSPVDGARTRVYFPGDNRGGGTWVTNEEFPAGNYTLLYTGLAGDGLWFHFLPPDQDYFDGPRVDHYLKGAVSNWTATRVTANAIGTDTGDRYEFEKQVQVSPGVLVASFAVEYQLALGVTTSTTSTITAEGIQCATDTNTQTGPVLFDDPTRSGPAYSIAIAVANVGAGPILWTGDYASMASQSTPVPEAILFTRPSVQSAA